jgi:hypothetical protein
MIVKNCDHRLSLSDPLGLLIVSQGTENPSQMKAFHLKPFAQMRNHYLWLDAEGRHTSASWYM